ncbi:unnamed protein product [marine sediment metagenome]|uniref:Uncharacterized protein n=1 Tax=marine sediment metagenome TaxID=412755 RepID=X1H8P8_9ZZZZ
MNDKKEVNQLGMWILFFCGVIVNILGLIFIMPILRAFSDLFFELFF